MSGLVGRERHLRELRLLVDGVSAARGNLVVLSGEAGAGKTRLAEEAAALAIGAGVEVAWATCWSNAAAPLSTWLDLLATVDPQATPTTPTAPGEPSAGEVDPDAARALPLEVVTKNMEAAG